MDRLVVIESPYAGKGADCEGQVEQNLIYLRDCIRECCLRGDSPYASHRMLTEALDDLLSEERALGIRLGLLWRRTADMRLFYIDRGWSDGMLKARELYDAEKLSYEIRALGDVHLESWHV